MIPYLLLLSVLHYDLANITKIAEKIKFFTLMNEVVLKYDILMITTYFMSFAPIWLKHI